MRDAEQAADEVATEDGTEPDHLIRDAISWALGEQDQAPFTGRPTPGGASRSDVDTEIAACHTYLQSTPWSEGAERTISRAQDLLPVLEWLTGAQDTPPTYRRETEPGHLIGGRGRIIRTDAEIRHMLAMARAKLAAGQTSYALGTDWHRGVIATLEWVLGEQPESPVLRSARNGLPDGARIAVEQAEAEELTTPPLREPGIPFHFADAVAAACRWLLGGTTRPPVTGGD